eukprot:6172190-Pleurochrysis_carterae.AAC.1
MATCSTNVLNAHRQTRLACGRHVKTSLPMLCGKNNGNALPCLRVQSPSPPCPPAPTPIPSLMRLKLPSGPARHITHGACKGADRRLGYRYGGDVRGPDSLRVCVCARVRAGFCARVRAESRVRVHAGVCACTLVCAREAQSAAPTRQTTPWIARICN